jgi:hypothetical protein
MLTLTRTRKSLITLTLFLSLSVAACNGCATAPAEVYVSPSGDQVNEARARAVKIATTITATMTITTQALEVADDLERSMLLKPDVLREMAKQSKLLAKVASETLDVLEGVAGGATVDLKNTLQVVLREFEGLIKLFEGTANDTLKQLAQAARAVLTMVTIGGVE